MARSLMILDRGEGMRVVRARAQRTDGELRQKLTELVEKPPS